MLNLAPIDQRDDLATKGYVDDAVGAVKAPYGLSVSSNLSSAGWYRVMQTKDISGSVFDFEIGRPYQSAAAEAHKVTLMIVGGGKTAFVGEESIANNLYVDKIRVTYGNGLAFVDIHYAASAANEVHVDFTVSCKARYDGLTYAESLQSVADAPAGETVLTTYEFAANTRNGALLIEDITVGSATIEAGAAKNITKTLSKTGYTPIAVAGFYGSGNTNVAVGDCFINSSNVLNMYLINTGTSSRTSTMNAKILWQKD